MVAYRGFDTLPQRQRSGSGEDFSIYTRTDIARAVSAGAFQRGEAYYAEERVLSWARAEGGVIRATVRGSHGRSYAVRIGAQPPLQGTCDCPVGYNCKHVVATLLAALGDAPSGPLRGLKTPGGMGRENTRNDCHLASGGPGARATIKPTPHLHLTTAKLSVRPRYRKHAGRGQLVAAIARLALDYGGAEVSWSENRPRVWVDTAEARVEVLPDQRATWQALMRLQKFGFGPLVGDDAVVVPDLHRQDLALCGNDVSRRLADFTLYGAPALEKEGWRITYADDYPYRPISYTQAWYGEIREAPEPGWFDWELGILVDGERINLLPAILRMIENYPEGMSLSALQKQPPSELLAVPLEKGGIVPIPAAKVAEILATFAELYEGRPGEPVGTRLPGPLPFLPEDLTINGAKIAWHGAENLRALTNALVGHEGLPAVDYPLGLKAALRPYQKTGLDWLAHLARHDLNGVLADDMGLGKTLQTLALFQHDKEAGRLDRPCLIVAPTSLMDNWRREAARFTPGLKVLVLQGPGRQRRFQDIAAHDIVLTTYPLLARDEEALRATPFHYLVFDEAHILKNPRTAAAQAARRIQGRHKLALTGTPLENHLGELWALFDLLMPGLLGELRGFTQRFRTAIEKHHDATRRDALRKRIAPFLLRRTKEKVAPELPPKTEIIETVALTGSQRDLYEALRLALHDKVRRAIAKRGLTGSRIIILDALLKLRQVCCDPRLVKTQRTAKARPSAKLNLLREMVPALIEEGRHVLIFSQFTSMLALIAESLAELHVPYAVLTGDTRDRATPVDAFQEGRVPVFLVSLKAGGAGLNLTTADAVIHYDPWWNPAVERQATDRAHRLGQVNPVFVYKLIAEGTVEEKILALQAKKLAMTSALLSDSAEPGTALQAEDLEGLFGPIPHPSC